MANKGLVKIESKPIRTKLELVTNKTVLLQLVLKDKLATTIGMGMGMGIGWGIRDKGVMRVVGNGREDTMGEEDDDNK